MPVLTLTCKVCSKEITKQEWKQRPEWVHLDEEISLTTLKNNYDHAAYPDFIDTQASREIL